MTLPTFEQLASILETERYLEYVRLLDGVRKHNRIDSVIMDPRWNDPPTIHDAGVFVHENMLVSGLIDEDSSGSSLESSNDYEPIRHAGDHLGLAKTMLGYQKKPDYIPAPLITNMELCGDRSSARWRKGNKYETRAVYPASKHIQELMTVWATYVTEGMRQFETALPDVRSAFVWSTRDLFVSIHPFERGNRATAHLDLQVTLTNMNLPKMWILNREMGFHNMRFSFYQNAHAIPLFRSLGYIPSLPEF